MKYSIKIWNNDELIQEIELNGKKYSRKLLHEAKRMCKWFKEYVKKDFTCIDLCKNGDAWINLISNNEVA